MPMRSPFAWTSQYLFSYFFSYGVYLPFWAVWFSYMGMSATQIGILSGIGFIMRAMCNLFITPLIHRPEQLLPTIRWVTLASVVVMGLHLVVGPEFWVLALITIVFNLVSAPLIPLSDSVANHYQSKGLLDYGRTRLWGSLAFIAGTWCVGQVSENIGESMIPLVALAGLVVALVASTRQPTILPKSDDESATRTPLKVMLKRSDVRRFLVITSLLQSSHAAYYAFSAIHWRANGISDGMVSNLWSISVIAEVMIFIFGKDLFKHWSVSSMMRLAACAAIVRWSLLGMTTQIYLLGMVQTLHCLTFAAAHLAAIKYIQGKKQSEQVAWQSLYNAIPLGLIMGGLTVLCGQLYSLLNAQLFFAMACLVIPTLLISINPRKPKSEDGSQSDVIKGINH